MSQAVLGNTTIPSRRLFLAAGTAAAVFGALHAEASSAQDRFSRLHFENLRIQREIDGSGLTEEDAAPLFNRWREIDNEVLDMKPANAAEVVGLLLYARREHLQFAMQFELDEAEINELIVLHAIDGALSILQPAREAT